MDKKRFLGIAASAAVLLIAAACSGGMGTTPASQSPAGTRAGRVVADESNAQRPPAMTEYALPAGSTASDLAYGRDGNIWVTLPSPSPGSLLAVTPNGLTVRTVKPPPNLSTPLQIALGAHNNFVVTDTVLSNGVATGGGVGLVQTNGAWTSLDIKTSNPCACDVENLGNTVWLSDMGSGTVAPSVSAVDGIHRGTKVANAMSPTGLAGGRNSIWVALTVTGVQSLGHLILGHAGAGYYQFPNGASGLVGRAVQLGKTVYFTEPTANLIGAFSVQTKKTVEYTVPSTNSGVYYITSGSDGNVYFTEPLTNKLGRLTPIGTGSVKIAEFPTLGNGPGPIVRGPKNTLYLIEQGSNKLVRVKI